MNKRLSKDIASFDYFDKSLIVLTATSGSISIASFATVIGTPGGIASASLCITFSLSTELVKKLLKTTRNKKNKHSEIVMIKKRHKVFMTNLIFISVSDILLSTLFNLLLAKEAN